MSVSRNNIQLTTSDPQENGYGILGLSLIHDLSGPLTAAMMDIERLNNSLKVMNQSVIIAQEGINKTKRVSRFNLKTQFNFSINKLRRKSHLVVPIRLSIPGNIWIRGDRIKFGIIIDNLLANAVESYNPHNAYRRPIEVRAKCQNKWLSISIRDYGGGMMRTNKSTTGHLGLGLPLANHIIKHDFQGKIVFRRVIGRGTSCQILVGGTTLIYN